MNTLRDKLEEWAGCDSISRKETLKDEIEQEIIPILRKEARICYENGVQSFWFPDSNYRHDSGYFKLEGYSKDSVEINYEAHWRYEGYCSFTEPILLREIEEFCENNLLRRIKTKKNSAIRSEIRSLKQSIAADQKKLARLKIKAGI